MEEIVTPPIESPAPNPVAQTSLPPGVNRVGETAPLPQSSTVGSPVPPQSTGLNYLRIGAGIVIVTALCYSIYYFRIRTRNYSESIKEQDKKIAANSADIQYILNPDL